jgi:hypothetical protein
LVVGYGNSPELQVSLMVPFNGYRMNQNRPHDLKDLAALSLGQKSKGNLQKLAKEKEEK